MSPEVRRRGPARCLRLFPRLEDSIGLLQPMNDKDFKAQYRTPEWKAKRAEVMKEAGGKCEDCGLTKNLQIHHPKYLPGRKVCEYDDLQCLCASCHRKADWKRKRGETAPTAMVKNPLSGKFFHSIGQDGFLCWQGQVLGEVQAGFFLVQLFSWLDGDETNCEIVPFEDMLGWLFYQTSEEMVYSYDYGPAKRLKAPLNKESEDDSL